MMDYTIDTIPAKLFFKILNTGEISLLSKVEKPEEELQKVWEQLENDHSKITKNDYGKSMNLYKRMEALGAKYKAVGLCVHYLNSHSDAELIEILKGFGYSFKGEMQEDLERIERESRAIETKIARLQKQLPEASETEKENDLLGFDQAVMSYAAFTGAGFVDTNKITVTQYYSLINMGNEKLKSIEKNGKR